MTRIDVDVPADVRQPVMAGGRVHVTVSAGAGPLSRGLVEAWRFRGLARRFASRDITLRYRQTSLGVGWVVLQPLLAAGAFTLVFGKIAKLPSDGVPYLPFALSGLVFWTMFSATISKVSASLIANQGLVSKVYFPRLVLPLSTLGTVLLDGMVGAALLAVVMVVGQVPTTLGVLLVPLFVLGVLALGLGVGLVGAAFSARYRDIVYVLTALLQAMLYISPVGYGLSAVPKSLRLFYALNPLSGYLEGARWLILGTAAPSVAALCYSVTTSALCLWIGTLLYHRKQVEFADVL